MITFFRKILILALMIASYYAYESTSEQTTMRSTVAVVAVVAVPTATTFVIYVLPRFIPIQKMNGTKNMTFAPIPAPIPAPAPAPDPRNHGCHFSDCTKRGDGHLYYCHGATGCHGWFCSSCFDSHGHKCEVKGCTQRVNKTQRFCRYDACRARTRHYIPAW